MCYAQPCGVFCAADRICLPQSAPFDGLEIHSAAVADALRPSISCCPVVRPRPPSASGLECACARACRGVGQREGVLRRLVPDAGAQRKLVLSAARDCLDTAQYDEVHAHRPDKAGRAAGGRQCSSQRHGSQILRTARSDMTNQTPSEAGLRRSDCQRAACTQRLLPTALSMLTWQLLLQATELFKRAEAFASALEIVNRRLSESMSRSEQGERPGQGREEGGQRVTRQQFTNFSHRRIVAGEVEAFDPHATAKMRVTGLRAAAHVCLCACVLQRGLIAGRADAGGDARASTLAGRGAEIIEAARAFGTGAGPQERDQFARQEAAFKDLATLRTFSAMAAAGRAAEAIRVGTHPDTKTAVELLRRED